MKKFYLLMSCWILVLCLSACSTNRTTNEIITANQERASEIISALARYQQAHGQFPDQLDLLVPTYLAQIPITISGQNFEYQPNALEGYYLLFLVDSDESLACGYNKRLEGWDCSRGD
jgi:hypothetical protein